MGRFALAFAAIVILTLSAWPTHGQQVVPLNAGAVSAAAFQNATDSFRADLMLTRRTASHAATPRSPREEPPAPALLVYLVLILVGSVASVALTRRRLGGEI